MAKKIQVEMPSAAEILKHVDADGKLAIRAMPHCASDAIELPKPGGRPALIVRDAVGNVLADGDQVTLIKDLDVKGAGQILKRGTLIKSIRLTGDAQEIDCRYEGIKGLVLRAEFVRKR